MKLGSILMLMIMALLLIVACSNSHEDVEDNNAPIDVSMITGRWLCVEVTEIVNGKTYSSPGLDITIYENSYTSRIGRFGLRGTYRINGSKIIVDTDTGKSLAITVSFSDNRMIWTGSDNDVLFTYVYQEMPVYLGEPSNW